MRSNLSVGRLMVTALAALAAMQGVARADANDPVVIAAKQRIAGATAPVTEWKGPTSGPKAVAGKFVIYVSQDQRNGGASGVANGVLEAAKVIGWRATVVDGQGSLASWTAALNQAIAQQPDGIVLGTIDAVGVQASLTKAGSLGVKVVGWHSGPKPGPIEDPPVFTNISSPPLDIALLAADYAIALSNGKAQVAIMRTSETLIGRVKGETMKAEFERCKECKVLSYDVMPIADASTRAGPLTTSLKQRFPTELTWMLGVNDLYFDFGAPALRAAGVPPSGPPQFISAGDGSISAYGRIRDGQYQVATVPEPLNMQGWQAVDELNRAFAGAQPSGFVSAVHLVTKDNIGVDGGPENRFDPANGYRDHYKAIWGAQ